MGRATIAIHFDAMAQTVQNIMMLYEANFNFASQTQICLIMMTRQSSKQLLDFEMRCIMIRPFVVLILKIKIGRHANS